MYNTIVWFDIPVKNMERARSFYQKVFDVELQNVEEGPSKMAMFPFEEGSASGALVEAGETKPSMEGTVIYLNGGDDLDIPLAKVEESGGHVLAKKTKIGDYGYTAEFEDTEGNRIAIHSPH